ncbi:MAG: hypothetical protein ACFB8W_20365 [Elainellaceae cyanobacterium]
MPEDETRLMYVAMTRATDHLLMTCDRPSEFAKKIKAVLFNTKSVGLPHLGTGGGGKRVSRFPSMGMRLTIS